MKLTIGEKIALLRKEKDITQTQLAEYLCLAPQTVSRWEVGNGAPEITLLPRIAAFFGVSIDELFGVTSLERAEDLVCRYSVLRDDRSFQEAMECVNSQLQTIDACLKHGEETAAELEAERDQLEAEKMHLWIQQGRESLRRAAQIADAFVEKTEGSPDHPWYLRMRLQRNQLRANQGRGREALAECRRDFAEAPGPLTLQLYLNMLLELQDYEAILSIQETEPPAKPLLFPVSDKNLDLWLVLIHAAAGTGGTVFVEAHMPQILMHCTEQDEYGFLMCLLPLYRGEQEKRAAIKKRLYALLPGMQMNPYFLERAKAEIEAG